MNRSVTLLFILLLSCFTGLSQDNLSKNVTLDWVESPVLTSRNKSINIPTVKNQFLDDNQLPIYSESWPVSGGNTIRNYTITNVQYQSLSLNEGNGLDTDKIPSTLKSDLKISKSNDKSEVALMMTPLVRQDGVVKKVTSFSLNYQLINGALRSTNISKISNSVLASGNWYKFSVDTTGVFKIDRSFLQSLGMDVSKINPKNLKVYGNGGSMLPNLNSDFRYDDLQENAVFISGEDDEQFNSEDYLLFYAKGPHDWQVDVASNNAEHNMNIFADESFYFITSDGGQGKRIQNDNPIEDTPTQQITSFDDYTFYEKDNHNLFSVGQQWFGESFYIDNVQTFKIPFKNIDGSEDVKIRVRGVSESYSTSSMDIKVNGQDLFTINYRALNLGSLILADARESEGFISLTGGVITVEITYNNNGNPSAKGYLDFIEIVGEKQLVLSDSQASFRSFDLANSTGIGQYQIQNAVEIWDVTDFLNPIRITNQSTTNSFEFNANGGVLNEYVAMDQSEYYTPALIQNSYVPNQNLHGYQDVDYIVVTQNYLIGEANRLAEFHRDRGLIVEVVDVEHIYNEFSSGSPDLTAIRDFTKYLYNNATSKEKKIKYLCLFGDSSYDYKDRINGNNNIVPVVLAYESFNLATSYVTDDYYGMMDPSEGNLIFSDKQDVATGRIPISTISQASDAVNKVIDYNGTKAFGDWRNLVSLVADDLDVASESVLQESMEKMAIGIETNKPLLNVKKVWADAYVQEVTAGGERYPTVKSELTNIFEKGTLLMNYFGHGGQDGWASEQILRIPQIQELTNYDYLPLVITITCEFSRFDDPLRLSGGEFLIWNKKGGSISLITTTREIYINVGKAFNEQLMVSLLKFNDENLTMSQSLMETKNRFSTSQRLFIYYLGDPAMTLAVPNPDIKLTKMNGIDVTQSLDTIKALSKVTFSGIVTDPGGNIIEDYNGELSTIIFDKPIGKTTLDNDNHDIYMDFDVLESKLFRGRSSVQNGQFTFDFVAPRDLRIAYGAGKISFYADDNINDKAGYNFDVIIGGINESAPEDNQGPQIKLFMNDESFVDGGNTNSSPFLLAVLEDENGINTSITAVDHDIVAILDGNTSNPYILNDFYQTELNDYTKGKAKFPFRDLEAGLHTIELCAWDTYNNNSCATLSFIVVNDSELVLDNVLNYPNPFINYTEFWFNHNKPNEPLEVRVQIFTVSGKLIKTINKEVNSTGNLSRSVTWDGLDDFGERIGKGVYIYKLNVKSSLSNVKAEKYEKLVILQ